MRWNTLLLIVSLLLIVTSSSAQEDSADLPLIAGYDVDANLIIWGLDETPILLTQHRSIWEIMSYYDTVPPAEWSNDSALLVFPEPSMGYITVPITIYDITDNSSWQIDADAVKGTPFAFSENNQQIYYFAFGEPRDAPTPTGMTGTWLEFPLLLRGFEAEMNAQPQEILDEPITYIFAANIGGGEICPVDLIAEAEAQVYRSFLPRFFENTPHGLLAYYDDTLMLDMESVGITGLSHFALSNDHAQLMAVQDETNIGLIDLETLDTQVFETNTPIEDLAWNGGDYAYYTTVEYGDELITNEDYEIPSLSYPALCEATINSITIHRLNLETSEQNEIYTEAFSAINRMTLSPDGDALYFSAIPNGEAWLENKRADNCALDGCVGDLMPSVFRLDLGAGEADLILEDVLKASFGFPE